MHFVKVVLGFTKLTRGFGEKYILFEKPVKMRRKKFMVKEKPATGACVMVMFCKGTVASPSIVDWTIVCFIFPIGLYFYILPPDNINSCLFASVTSVLLSFAV